MKVTNVDLYCSCSEHVLNLSYRDPASTNKYNVKSIYGLDADEIISSYYASGSISNDPFYTMASPKRDIVVRLVLNPDYQAGETVSDLRDRLYRAISSNRTGVVELRFKDGAVEQASVKGFVSKFEAAHFSEVPELQMTITCQDPMLRAPLDEIISGESLNQVSPWFQDLVSTAPHGATFIFKVVAVANSIEFTQFTESGIDPDWSFKILPPITATETTFINDDLVYISSINKQRSVSLIRGVNKIQLADKIQPFSVWPAIFPGNNQFTIIESTKYKLHEINHRHSFWGV